jgi:hypothetical protein
MCDGAVCKVCATGPATLSTASCGDFALERHSPQEMRRLELDLPPLPTMDRVGHLGERRHRSRRDDGAERAPQHR